MDWSLTSPARNGSWPLQAKSEAGVAWGRSQELQEFRSCRMRGLFRMLGGIRKATLTLEDIFIGADDF
jgi:hypothetical protein